MTYLGLDLIFSIQENCHKKTIAYARVSSHKKDDLERYKQVLELYYASQGWTYEIISD
ncbi:hypothetical protein [Bartonella sp. AS69XJJH]|uniref:hypothetical protein n=1 Tax=Bartonella sp. AS69XJJH TaxID=3243508 RepID=UPI0035D0FB73